MSYTRTEGRPVLKDTVIPRFHVEAVEDPVASAREGRSCYRSEERIQFLIPGSPNQPVEIVNQGHIDRWPDHYKAFKDGQDMSANGTPLEMWPILKKPQVFELKALQIHTVEQVAELADTAIQRINFGHRLRELARAYLDDAAALALTQQQSAEIQKQNSEIAELRNTVGELRQLVDQLHSRHMLAMNAQPALATYVPGDHDPAAIAAQLRPMDEGGPSALDSLPSPRRRKTGEAA